MASLRLGADRLGLVYLLIREVTGLAIVREADLPQLGVRPDGVAFAGLSFEQPQRERVLEEPLDRALERSRAVGRVPARIGDQLAGAIGQLERDPALGQPPVESITTVLRKSTVWP